MRVQTIERGDVLAYRAAASGLHREVDHVGRLSVLDLGLQDTPPGAAELAAAVRLPTAGPDPLTAPDLAVAWTVRGAPHVHRAAELPAVAARCWPLDTADATARLASSGVRLRDAGVDPLGAIVTTAQVVRRVLTTTMAKGTLSAAVTAAVPEEYSTWCRPCGSRHVTDTLLRCAALAGGARIVAGSVPVTFEPAETPIDPEALPSPATRLGEVVDRYLDRYGIVTPADAAGWLGTAAGALAEYWPDGLVEARLEGRRVWSTTALLDRVVDAPAPPKVRLLPAGDPLLQARDRELLVPDRTRRPDVWKSLGNPGVVLLDGEVAGTWRARAGQRGALSVQVHPFAPLTARARRGVVGELERLAAVRAAERLDVEISDE